jgi:hypothetical protein
MNCTGVVPAGYSKLEGLQPRGGGICKGYRERSEQEKKTHIVDKATK